MYIRITWAHSFHHDLMLQVVFHLGECNPVQFQGASQTIQMLPRTCTEAHKIQCREQVRCNLVWDPAKWLLALLRRHPKCQTFIIKDIQHAQDIQRHQTLISSNLSPPACQHQNFLDILFLQINQILLSKLGCLTWHLQMLNNNINSNKNMEELIQYHIKHPTVQHQECYHHYHLISSNKRVDTYHSSQILIIAHIIS